MKHPLVTAAVRRPDQLAALPYAYGMSAFPTPPFYTKVPSPREQAMVEQDLTGHLREKLDPGWLDVNYEAVPDLISAGQQVMAWGGEAVTRRARCTPAARCRRAASRSSTSSSPKGASSGSASIWTWCRWTG
ncbi:MAG: hypothetical protein U0263_36350 [Polyangiaceae bacterium]